MMQYKRTYYHLVILILLLVSMGSSTQAQRVVDAVAGPFNAYIGGHLQEKLFVHTDKKFYVAGEIIWFKIYATDAQTNRPFNFSKIAYVEILSRDAKPVLQAKVALNNSSGNGSFQLPYSVNSGNYIFRAYTNWMKNAGPEFYFEKEISIVNALKRSEWPAAETTTYDAQFFPEGGDMVHGIPSKIAFKVLQNGKGISCNGAILNRRNDTITRFTTHRFGMGHFDLTPDAGEEYHAVVFAGGTTLAKPLPRVNATGLAMRLTEIDKDRISVSIQSNKAGAVVSLLVHTRQQLKLSLSRELFNGKTEIEIDKKQLGDGISHFTLFNANNQPVCERLYFKRPAETLNITAATDAQRYGSRRKVTVDLLTNSNLQLPVSGDLSMSVYMTDGLQYPESSDILSYLWLQSDLKGVIEEPGFYFSGQGPDADAAADNLMLTQGWRRFRWEDVLQTPSSTPAFLPELEGHIINGRVVDKRNGQPAENIAAYLSVPAEKPLFTGSVSGKNGAIRFNVKNFYGGNEMVVQPGPADSLFRVDIQNPFSEKYNLRPLPGLALLQEKNALQEHSLHSQVTNAYFSERQKFLFPPSIDTIPFYGIPDHRYYLDDYTRFVTMEEVMREYVGDVRVRKEDGHFSFRVRNQAFDNLFQTSPLVLFDGVPVFDIDKIMAFDPLKVKSIDVVAQKFFQHNMVHDGIISYSTYQGDLAGFQLDGNALVVEYGGLQLQREFYSPVYETPDKDSRVPDFRNVLYWSPSIQTDKNGRKQISFYTSDIPGNYSIVIQGITSSGLAGSRTAVFSVTN